MLCNCTMKDMWIDVLDRLPKSGEEVLCYFILDEEDLEDGKPYPYYTILTYYEKGALIDYAIDYSIASPEERLIDMLTNKDNERVATENGFYVIGEKNYKHKPTIIAWMSLERPNYCKLD